MKSVVFSASVTNYHLMDSWAAYLRQHDVAVDLPIVAVTPERWLLLDRDEQRRHKLKFIDDHCRRIDNAKVLFVFNVSGHIGNSVTLEMGYALAKGKVIYAVQQDNEDGRDVLFAGYCPTPEALLARLEE